VGVPDKPDKDRVSIPLEPEEALRALLKVDPDAEPEKQDDPAERRDEPGEPRDA